MNNIMLDIETLGNTVNSAIVQISMVKFDECGNIGESININVDTNEQLGLGAETTQSTLDWWNKTNPLLLQELKTTNLCTVLDAIKIINKFISFNDKIWCHATFDLPILGNMYRLAKKTPPWRYKFNRDIRTLIDLSDLDLAQYNWDKEKTHNAYDDCLFQIKYVCDAIKKLKQ